MPRQQAGVYQAPKEKPLSQLFGANQHLLLTGGPGMGKSTTLRQWARGLYPEARYLPVFSCDRLISSPELFVFHFAGALARVLLDREIVPFPLEASAEQLQAAFAPYPLASKALKSLVQDVHKDTLDYSRLFREVWSLPEALAKDLGFELVLFFDDIEAIVPLKNFPDISDPLDVVLEVLAAQKKVRYVLACGSPALVSRISIVRKGRNFPGVGELKLEALSAPETTRLAQALGGAQTDVEEVYNLTQGIPAYLYPLCLSLANEEDSHLRENPKSRIQRHFFRLLLARDGVIGLQCAHWYETRLLKARGFGILKALMRSLAWKNGQRLVTLADTVKKLRPPTKEYLHSLLDVDLILRQGYYYFLPDPIFGYWLRCSQQEPPIIFSEEMDPAPYAKELAAYREETEAVRANCLFRPKLKVRKGKE